MGLQQNLKPQLYLNVTLEFAANENCLEIEVWAVRNVIPKHVRLRDAETGLHRLVESYVTSRNNDARTKLHSSRDRICHSPVLDPASAVWKFFLHLPYL